MTANAWQVYDIFYDEMGSEGHDITGADVLKVALHLVGYTPAPATDVTQSVIGNEHAAAAGYATGGDIVALVGWSTAAGVLTFDVADPTWDATGGDIVARYAVLYNSTPGTNDLIAYCLMDNTPDDITCTDGNTLTINVNVSGIFTATQT